LGRVVNVDAALLQFNREVIEGTLASMARVFTSETVDEDTTWKFNGQSYPCSVQQAAEQNEIDVSDRTSLVGTWVIKLPWNARVDATKRLQVDGQMYEIKGMNNKVEERYALSVYCETIE
jgi:hypothetical protein